MRGLAALDIKGGREDHANHFRQEFVTPDRQSSRACLAVPLQDGDPLSGAFAKLSVLFSQLEALYAGLRSAQKQVRI